MPKTSKLPMLKLAVPAAAALLVYAALAAHGQGAAGPEPIAFIGHGAMFDSAGKPVSSTAASIRRVQAWYRDHLLGKLSGAQRAEFAALERRLMDGPSLDAQSRLVANAYLIEWLIRTAGPDDGGRMEGKNNLMKALLEIQLPRPSEVGRARPVRPFRIDPALEARIAAERPANSRRRSAARLVGVGGQAYRDLCAAEGVPLPPNIGDMRWVNRGTIRGPDLFIETDKDADVMTYRSTTPDGLCIALPRYWTMGELAQTVELDGVICLGVSRSKACFWDNEKDGIKRRFRRTERVDIREFGGGTELVASSGGICSDCHAGENPYIIHTPVLDLLRVPGGLPTFPAARYEAIVRTGDVRPWPENPEPMPDTAVPSRCVGCHSSLTPPGLPDRGGRFPHLSSALPGYCNMVLGPSIRRTMPLDAPGALAPGEPLEDRAVTRLMEFCGMPPTGSTADRGEPHITTFNGVDYDFQAAGEFTALRHEDGMEIQTRQTPIATTVIPPPNPHTGLGGCVSVNSAVAARVGKARVSWQPNLSGQPDPSGMQLRVDGRETSVESGPVSLPGGGRIMKTAVGHGIEVLFPNRTRMIATARFWAPQRVWHLDLDVIDTPAREGVMGAILPGDWLPPLANGAYSGPRPASLRERHRYLNRTFADSWRLRERTSLFDYAPGTSTATFTNRGWPPASGACAIPGSPVPPAQPMEPAKAAALCAKLTDGRLKAQCLFDVTVTGEAGFAESYLVTQALRARLTGSGARTASAGAGKTAARRGWADTLLATLADVLKGRRAATARAS